MDKLKGLFHHNAEKTDVHQGGDDTSGNYANTGFDADKYAAQQGTGVPAYERGPGGELLDRSTQGTSSHTRDTTDVRSGGIAGAVGGLAAGGIGSGSTAADTADQSLYPGQGYSGGTTHETGPYSTGLTDRSRIPGYGTNPTLSSATGSVAQHGRGDVTGRADTDETILHRAEDNLGISSTGRANYSSDAYIGTGRAGGDYPVASGNYGSDVTGTGKPSSGIIRHGIAEELNLEGVAESDKPALVRAYEAEHGEGTSGRVGDAVAQGNFGDEISENTASSQKHPAGDNLVARDLSSGGQQPQQSQQSQQSQQYSQGGYYSSGRDQQYATGATGGTSGLGSSTGRTNTAQYDYTSGSADTTRLGQQSGGYEQQYSTSTTGGLGSTSGLTGTSASGYGEILPGPAGISGEVNQNDPAFRGIVQELRHPDGIGGSAFITGAAVGGMTGGSSSYETGSALTGSRDGYGAGNVYDSSYQSSSQGQGQGLAQRAENALGVGQGSQSQGYESQQYDTSSRGQQGQGIVGRAEQALSGNNSGRTAEYSSTSGSTGQGYRDESEYDTSSAYEQGGSAGNTDYTDTSSTGKGQGLMARMGQKLASVSGDNTDQFDNSNVGNTTGGGVMQTSGMGMGQGQYTSERSNYGNVPASQYGNTQGSSDQSYLEKAKEAVGMGSGSGNTYGSTGAYDQSSSTTRDYPQSSSTTNPSQSNQSYLQQAKEAVGMGGQGSSNYGSSGTSYDQSTSRDNYSSGTSGNYGNTSGSNESYLQQAKNAVGLGGQGSSDQYSSSTGRDNYSSSGYDQSSNTGSGLAGGLVGGSSGNQYTQTGSSLGQTGAYGSDSSNTRTQQSGNLAGGLLGGESHPRDQYSSSSYDNTSSGLTGSTGTTGGYSSGSTTDKMASSTGYGSTQSTASGTHGHSTTETGQKSEGLLSKIEHTLGMK